MKLICNGTLVGSRTSRQADILIDGEKIVRIAPRIDRPGVEMIDASGLLVFPGFIDAHTHLDLEAADSTTADDFASGTRAAAAGGTTTVIDFATQYRGQTLRQALEHWNQKAAAGCSCDYGYHMAITDWNPAVRRECGDMMDAGVTSFKVYLTYATKVDDRTLFEIMVRLKEIGGIVGVHCENDGLIAALQEEYVRKGGLAKVSSHYLSRPAAAEAEAIGRMLHFAEVAGTPVIDVHMTCEEGMEEVRAARKRGQKVYVETCPQYLCLNDSVYELPDFEGAKYVIAPPLRKKSDNAALWKALAGGEIQTVSTDHCSFTFAQKELGRNDFRRIPCGMPGVENRGMLLYSEGVAKGRITREKMCEVLCENPAKLYGLYPRKGVLAEGSDADLVLLNPDRSRTVTVKDQISRCDYSPYEGWNLTGTIDRVYLRGELVAQGGRVVAENRGRFLKRGKYNL